MAAIRADRPYNEVQRGVEASLVTSMGRMSAHTGQVVTFEQMLNCEHEFAPGLDVSAGVHNIFDRAYRDPVSPDFAPIDSVPRDGRTWRLQATKRF